MGKHTTKSFYLVLITLAFIWLKSGYGKITGGTFVDSLSPILAKFLSNNPYSWYKEFLTGSIIPNAPIFAQMIQWGEVFAAVCIGGSALYFIFSKKQNPSAGIILLIGLFIGMLLNLNFWFASGWMSPSADSLNFLMFVIEFIAFMGIFLQLKNGGVSEAKK